MREVAERSLADRQAALVAALTAGKTPPAGFDPSRIELAAAMLRHKKLHGVRSVRPELARLLGGRFEAEFQAFLLNSQQNDADAQVMAAAFARFAIRSPRLPAGLRVRIALAYARRKISAVARKFSRSRRRARGVQCGSERTDANQE